MSVEFWKNPMNTNDPEIKPDWRWATPEGNRELDRLLDRRLTFLEKLEWLEEVETMFLFMHAKRLQDPAQEPHLTASLRALKSAL